MSADQLISTIRDFFEAGPNGVVAVYLFGSRARGSSHAGSDIDVGVLFDHTPSSTFEGLHLGLAGKLERRVGCPVDLIVLNRASADLIHRVLRDGSLVYERDPSARIRFEVQARNEYFDMQPIRRQYRQATGHPPDTQ